MNVTGAGIFSLFLDFNTVLIGTGLEKDIISTGALISGNGVGENDLIGVADVRLAGGIGDSRGDVIFTLVLQDARKSVCVFWNS